MAALYGVETRDINKAVKNNPDKFPKDYILELSDTEKKELVENFHHLEPLKYSKTNPKAFTEKGLYMLATILKSKQATQTTLLIIETFAKLRALQQTVATAAIEPRASVGETPEPCRRCSFRLRSMSFGRASRSKYGRDGNGNNTRTQFCNGETQTCE